MCNEIQNNWSKIPKLCFFYSDYDYENGGFWIQQFDGYLAFHQKIAQNMAVGAIIFGTAFVCFSSWTIIVAKNARKELLEDASRNIELQG